MIDTLLSRAGGSLSDFSDDDDDDDDDKMRITGVQCPP